MNETSLKSVPDTVGRVLAVEDDATSLLILTAVLESLHYEVIEATNGLEALDVLEREADTIDVILLDKLMPEMNGLEVVAALKDNPKARHIPVVMVTGSNQPEEIKEGIDAGMFYYLTKPYENDVLESILTSAMRESTRRTTLRTELKKHQTSFSFINKAEFTIQKLDEAEDLACFIANCFPNPETALPGLAGLLVNAVEHGNLEIGYRAKTALLKEGRWREEIEKRQNEENFEHKKVTVVLTCTDEETSVIIKDEGSGFKWESYLEIDPSRALSSHGRGIEQANKISFDTLKYNERGNVVTITSRNNSGIKW